MLQHLGESCVGEILDATSVIMLVARPSGDEFQGVRNAAEHCEVATHPDRGESSLNQPGCLCDVRYDRRAVLAAHCLRLLKVFHIVMVERLFLA